MQPYFFPYIGYFQLVDASDIFVSYDEVNFIKQGWINRNYVLSKPFGKQLITVPLVKASSFKSIRDIQVNTDQKWKSKLLKTLEFTYNKAPFYEPSLKLIKDVIEPSCENIGDLAFRSIQKVSSYIGLKTAFQVSSSISKESNDRTGRLLEICEHLNANEYINPLNGSELYSKEDFGNKSIELHFLKPNILPYKQFESQFIPSLSLIDVLMFNSPSEVRKLLKYSLV
jgi:hypothetical protein